MNANKITLHNVRARYPRLFRAEVNKLNPNGKAAYSMRIVLEEGHPELDALKKFCVEKAVEKFGESRAPKIVKAAKESKNTRGLHYDEDTKFTEFNAKRNEDRGAPLVVGRQKQDLTEAEGPQGGDWINVTVAPYWYDNQSRGLSFELLAVQFVKKGEPFPGEGVSASKDDFETLADDGEGHKLTEEELEAMI